MGAGIALSLPAPVAYGSALLCGVALARAFTLVSVARARAAGFEMLWTTGDRLLRVSREHELVITAELRNRDTLPTHFRGLTVTHSPHLEVRVSPESGEVPALGRLSIQLQVKARRVGYHGIFGLTLHTVRAPGLYTVPLSFSNPFVVEVLPRPVRLGPLGARGGRSRTSAPDGRVGLLPGDGPELRELREHRPGDPFKRIAWKASARRGRLLIVEKEREQRDSVWILLDASVDSASGPSGLSPLDLAVDEASHLVEYHLARGDLVGLRIWGSRELACIALGRGPRHAAALLSALAFRTHTADTDRSDWDERDVARRVLDHMRSLDPSTDHLVSSAFAQVAQAALDVLRRAPARAEAPWAPTKAERILRQYLLCFGIHPPPRGASDRFQTELGLARALRDIQRKRPRPSIVYLIGKPPTFETPQELLDALGRIPRRHTEIRFIAQDESGALASHDTEQAKVVREALAIRIGLTRELGEQKLGRLGVKVLRKGQRSQRPRTTTARSMIS